MLLRGLIWGAPLPSSSDPSHLLATRRDSTVELVGQVLADARRFDDRCVARLDVFRIDRLRRSGRSELMLRPCAKRPLQGWIVQVRGQLREPISGPHSLLPGSAERLAKHGIWSRLDAETFSVLRQPWTPIATARRRIAQRFHDIAGEERGGLMSALVLGSAQFPVGDELRQAFRIAGLSHCLAASGFHLSVLLAASLAVSRRWPRLLRLSLAAASLLIFLLLAGPQPSVVRAVLMGAIALLIRESSQRASGFGVLLFSLCVMLLIHPAWAGSIGFQLSAAATAGLVITAPALETALETWLPRCLACLAPALSIPCSALFWTLPLQLLHFGSAPLYAVISNLLVSPLLAPLTLLCMLLALISLICPSSVLSWLIVPASSMAGWLIALVRWISQWPSAHLLTGHPQPWLVGLFALGLIPCLVPSAQRWRGLSWILLPIGVLLHGLGQLGDGVVAVYHGQHRWLLARHHGRAAMVSRYADPRSCQMAAKLAAAHGHARLDWILLLDPAVGDGMSCWRKLGNTVASSQQGRLLVQPGQRLASSGLSVKLASRLGQPIVLRAGRQRWRLIATAQSLAALQQRPGQVVGGYWTGTWLWFQPSRDQRRWLLQQGAGQIRAVRGFAGSFGSLKPAL